MRQTVISVLSIGGADSRFSHAAERNAVEVHMNIGLIHTASPKRETGNELINRALVPAEDVAGKWPGATLDLSYCFLQSGISENWQDRPKDLTLHYLVGPYNRIENRWLEVVCGLVKPSSDNHLILID